MGSLHLQQSQPLWSACSPPGSWQPALGNSPQESVLKIGNTPDFPAEIQAAAPMGKPITRVLSNCASACASPTEVLPAHGSIVVSLNDQQIHSFKVLKTPFTLPGIPM